MTCGCTILVVSSGLGCQEMILPFSMESMGRREFPPLTIPLEVDIVIQWSLILNGTAFTYLVERHIVKIL